MIEAADVNQYPIQQVAVTTLTIIAVVLAGAGLLHALMSTLALVRETDAERRLRAAFRDEFEVTIATLAADKTMTATERSARQNKAHLDWRQRHVDAGIEAWDGNASKLGREFLAERLVRDLNESTRTDFTIAGIGLVLGVIASIWGTWLP